MELLSFLFAAVLLLKRRFSYWRLFIPYFLLMLLIEGGGFYLRTVLHKPNYLLYNFYMLVQFLFFSLLFYRFLPTWWMKQLVIYSLMLFLLLYLFENYQTRMATYYLNSRRLVSLLIVLHSCIFYFALLRDDGVRNPILFPPFWIVTGLFFYYFGTAVMFAFYAPISKIKLSGNISFYTLVLSSFSIILYGNWIIGFLCMRRQHPSSRR